MKHTIKVTVAEFLDNGGSPKALVGRDLFSSNVGSAIGTLVSVNVDGRVTIQRTRGTFEMDEQFVYVQIECTPIYK